MSEQSGEDAGSRRGAVEVVIRSVASAASLAAGLLWLILMVVCVYGALGRIVDLPQIKGTVELVEVALVPAVFLGVMRAETSKINVRTPLITNLLPGRIARACRVFGLTVAAGFTAWITLLTWRAAMDALAVKQVRYGLAEVPIWPAKMVIPLGFALLLAALLYNAWMALRAESNASDVQVESWM